MSPSETIVTADFLTGGGDMGARMRAFAWEKTPLGPPAQWPQSLRTAIRIMLTSRQPIWIGWGPALIYFYNDAYKSIIGGRHPWALGQPTRSVWREIWEEIGPMLDTAMNGHEGTYVEQQLLIMERNGYPEETYYTFSYSPVPGDDGAPGGIICANTDDTQRVISERQLQLLRDVGASALESRTWQDACERSTRALGADTYDLPFAALYVEDGPDRVVRAGLSGIVADHPAFPMEIRLDGAAPWPIAAVLRRTDGIVDGDISRFNVEFPSGAWRVPPTRAALIPLPALGEAGRAGVLIVGLNPFRLYDESYSSFLTLAAREIAGSMASAEAYEAERRRAEALAEIDRAKTAFFSNVSHEFRTPLTLMLTPLEDVLARSDDGISPESRGLLRTAHRNAVRLLKLVNALLDFSRIEAGRVEAAFAATDLSAITRDLASAFRSTIETAGLTFDVSCDDLDQPVYVDTDMWEKIVLNLLSNAFKFTFSGSIAVALRAAPDGRDVELSVTDTGTGIPPTELPRLFERFYRVENAKGRSFEGSGIGLALVQELVKLHGGTISVASEVGSGSRFTVRVPMGDQHIARENLNRRKSGRPSRAQGYLDEAQSWLTGSEAVDIAPGTASDAPRAEGAEGKHVLLADDNADMRAYVQRLLSEAGLHVEAVRDGRAALEAVRKNRPDLILSDVMMPELDGFGLLDAVRADPALREIPVVLLSARAGEEAKVEGLQSGADDYLVKPFTASELVARVTVHLRLTALRQERAKVLREEAETLETLTKVGNAIAAELKLDRAVQVVTDAVTQLCGASFGSFFYNVTDPKGESYVLYTLSGAPREAFSKFPQPRNTAIFAPTFNGEGIVRSDDITKDPRFGKNPPYHGHPKGHLPVRSYLAAPVFSQSGKVIGGLFLGHPEAGVFTARSERLIAGIAVQAGLAMDKAHLYSAAQEEIERRKVIEAALRESEQTLERKVAERTAELIAANDRLRAEARERERAEDALRQAQKMEGIGRLTGGIAHDFNNLLTVITGNLESAQRQVASGRAAMVEHSLTQAMRGAQRAASLTHRMLAFSRQQPLDPKPIDANRLVSGMSDMMRRTLGEHVAIQSVLAGGLWPVFVDPNQLEVAILNLAVNARDAMPDGGRLTIETANMHLDDAYALAHKDIVPGQYVAIVVTDNGTGMDAATIAKAFDPFFTTKEIGQGTGLGLSQVYGFVRQSGGHVKIYSEPGEGTSVKIYLPRLQGAAMPAEDSVPETEVTTGSGDTILVVEDDESVRGYTTGVLAELGYTVIEAHDGPSAIVRLEQNPQITMLFTDVGLPGGMTGRDVADRALSLRPDLKVLFTTGYARNAIVHEGRLDADVHLITKPFSFRDLAAKLRQILDAPTDCVLLVEDEFLIQEFAVEMLAEAGFKTAVASTAAEALEKLRQARGKFAAAIVDLGLPDSRGDLLVKQMRALYPRLRIVVASGQDRRDIRAQIGDGVEIVTKPYSREALLVGLGVSIN